MVDSVTTVVTPPAVYDPPDGRFVEVAAQTVVDSVKVMVVAGIVYTPGVGHVVAIGVGTTATWEVVGTMTVVVGGCGLGFAMDAGGGAIDEVSGAGGNQTVRLSYFSWSVYLGVTCPHTSSFPGDGSINCCAPAC